MDNKNEGGREMGLGVVREDGNTERMDGDGKKEGGW